MVFGGVELNILFDKILWRTNQDSPAGNSPKLLQKRHSILFGKMLEDIYCYNRFVTIVGQSWQHFLSIAYYDVIYITKIVEKREMQSSTSTQTFLDGIHFWRQKKIVWV